MTSAVLYEANNDGLLVVWCLVPQIGVRGVLQPLGQALCVVERELLPDEIQNILMDEKGLYFDLRFMSYNGL